MLYDLKLYITGATVHSMQAVKNIKEIGEQFIAGRYNLEIIDVYQQPQMASEMQIIATPTLIRLQPKPIKRLIGNLSDTQAVLAGLGISQ